MLLNLDIHYAVMLGLSEGELQSPSDLSVTRSDVAKIAQDLGVFLESPDRRYNEYLADKISSEIKNEVILSFAATDFSGQAQAPSLFWLQTARVEEGDIEVCHMPGSTRWDEIQNSSLEKSAIAPILKYIEQDIGLQPIENFKSARNLRISPSQMEKYLNCPFIFAAEKVFSLSDLPDVDLDVDAMTSGRIMHALLDQLLAEPLHFNWTDAELEKLIDKVKVSLALTIGEERLWPAKRQHYLRLAKNFIEFEKAWRAQFPYTQTIGRELRVKGKMILTDGLSVEVSGQIDRVDIYSNGKLSSPQYAVIDYKSSAAGLHNYGSWLKNDELQLAFYTLAIAQGLTELAIGDVIGAFYFVLSNMNRERGYRVSENVNLLFSENKRNRTQITAENLDVLLNEIKYKIAEVVKKIETGQFQAQPKDIKDCFHCSWRTLCRAPHLN